jgi:hypothetical protein
MDNEYKRINPIKNSKYIEMNTIKSNKLLRFNPITKEYYILKNIENIKIEEINNNKNMNL